MSPDNPVAIDPPLPVESVLPALHAALRQGHAILQAPTGSGKSTRVPLALLDADWLAGQGILMLQPRRPATRLTAARMAALLGEPLGGTVGFQVRFERRLGSDTRLVVVTEGILTRRLQSDPGLDGIGLVIFDEFHERNLHSDLGLALLLDVIANLRPELRLLLMSATLDTAPLARCLGEIPILRAEGRSFPVAVHYADRAVDPDPVAAVTTGVRRALTEQSGDVLAFLPGSGEINRGLERLRALVDPAIQILPLHGSLPSADQDLALHPGDPGQRRIILATDIAETSLTIQGVGAVVDTGLARKPRFDPGSGLTRLVTEPIARASAEQRAGRAGRLGPGRCYRLWTPAQEHGRPAQRTPEILESDLAPLVLELALWGVRDPGTLVWVDPPPATAWQQGVDLLTTLGALDPQRNLTPLGRALAELPVHPRLGVMLLGATESARHLAADLCALLSERDPLSGTPGLTRSADLGLRLRLLEAWRERRHVEDADPHRLAAIDRVARHLTRLAARLPAGETTTPGCLLALAYPERVAQRRDSNADRYLLALGSGAVLPRDDALTIHPYLVVAALDARGRDGRIQLALPISETELREVCAARIETIQQITWDSTREAAAAREVTGLGAITLSARPIPIGAMAEATHLLLQRVREGFERVLNWTEAARQLQARVLLMRAHEPDAGWPDLGTDTLRATLEDWLSPWLAGKTRLDEVRRLDLTALLTARLDWEQQQRLDREVPQALETPAGRRRPLDYTAGDLPILAVPLQELFGLNETPCVCRGRVPVLLHLLSPARRPIQVTQDLSGFWARGYAEVRRELRGRYPKHHWPEDPTQATAVAGGVRRRHAPP